MLKLQKYIASILGSPGRFFLIGLFFQRTWTPPACYVSYLGRGGNPPPEWQFSEEDGCIKCQIMILH